MLLAMSPSANAAIAGKRYAASIILRMHITTDQCDDPHGKAREGVARASRRTLSREFWQRNYFHAYRRKGSSERVQVAVLREIVPPRFGRRIALDRDDVAADDA
ncbi:hypothetical protein ACTGJ9_022470 [Bradyrhizobium sp. RDM12]